MQMKTVMAPAIFFSPIGTLLQIGWIILFVAGTVMLFIANWIVGLIAISVYWFVFPLLITRWMQERMLGPWDEAKGHLEPLGYTKDNYLDGDWWKKGRGLSDTD